MLLLWQVWKKISCTCFLVLFFAFGIASRVSPIKEKLNFLTNQTKVSSQISIQPAGLLSIVNLTLIPKKTIIQRQIEHSRLVHSIVIHLLNEYPPHNENLDAFSFTLNLYFLLLKNIKKKKKKFQCYLQYQLNY